MTTPLIDGQCDDGFGVVADAFRANFTERGELGAGFCLYVDGQPRVNLWGGVADRATGKAWTDETLQLVFSSTKGIAAICCAMLVDRGAMSYDDRVSAHWPEFATPTILNGKAELTIGEMLSHQGGLIALDPPLELDQILAVTPVVDNLAAQTPAWPRGAGHGYHAITYGWLVGELIARVDGRRINEFIQQEIISRVGGDFWVGLPESEEHRVATLEVAGMPTDPALIELLGKLYARGANGYRALTLDGKLRLAPENHFNSRRVHATEMPGANGITNAATLARIYAATVGGVDGNDSTRLVGPEVVDQARRQRVAGPDQTLLVDTRFGAGFWLGNDQTRMIADGSFGHPGAGGSLGYANPELGIGYGYVMNQMGPQIAGGPRTEALDAAVAACLS